MGCEEDMIEKGQCGSESPTETEQGCVLVWPGEEREAVPRTVHVQCACSPCHISRAVCGKYNVGERIWTMGP